MYSARAFGFSFISKIQSLASVPPISKPRSDKAVEAERFLFICILGFPWGDGGDVCDSDGTANVAIVACGSRAM